jgi:pyruvate ferredoxin oxidoreductase delta subunit
LGKAKIKTESELTWKDFNPGAIVTEPGSAKQYKTGAWRSQRPNTDLKKCTKCGICYVYCPEGCIKQDEQGYYSADLYHCKGCGICAKECPPKAITMTEEEE